MSGQGQPSRYTRSFNGMTGALIVTVLAVLAFVDDSRSSGVLTLVVGLAVGVVVLVVGVFAGGRAFDRRGPDLLAAALRN